MGWAGRQTNRLADKQTRRQASRYTGGGNFSSYIFSIFLSFLFIHFCYFFSSFDHLHLFPCFIFLFYFSTSFLFIPAFFSSFIFSISLFLIFSFLLFFYPLIISIYLHVFFIFFFTFPPQFYLLLFFFV